MTETKKKRKKASVAKEPAKAKKAATPANGASDNGSVRLDVAKTYKLYIGGAFVRSERGRYLTQRDAQGNFVANYTHATRKDFRNAMVKARKAQAGWSKRSAFNRSQILYRMAEMLEDRRLVFEEKLQSHAGYDAATASKEVEASIDRLFWYAGWADKYIQVVSSVNPIAAPFFNFSLPEPTGIVAVFSSQTSPLLGLISGIAPVILSGNACITIVENNAPTIAVDFAEVLATSDVPGGVVNILTGERGELISYVSEHMDLNAIAVFGGSDEQRRNIQLGGVENLKRVKLFDDPDAEGWYDDSQQSLYWITPFIETKTAWHPIGV